MDENKTTEESELDPNTGIGVSKCKDMRESLIPIREKWLNRELDCRCRESFIFLSPMLAINPIICPVLKFSKT